MLPIDDIYSICNDLVNKYKQGYLSPDEFNRFFNLSQQQYFNQLVGIPETYRPDKPLPVYGKMFNQTMQEKLAPFFVTSQVTLPGNARIPKPNVGQPGGFGSIIDILAPSGISANPRPQNKIYNYLTDSIDVISIDWPICIDMGSFFQVFPQVGWPVNSVFTFNYYKLPPDAKWGYNTDPDGMPVYDSSKSVQPIWNNNEYSELIALTIQKVGINLQQSIIMQYSQLQKQEG
jgi:hypothetical protein